MKYEKIIEVVKRKYGSLDEPNFHFVEKTISQRPYGALLSKLQTNWEIVEITDPNADVSFVFSLNHRNETLFLELSMIDKFALVMRPGYETAVELVVTPGSSVMEQKLFQNLDESGFTILEREVLERAVKMNLFYTDPGEVKIYQALFSDVPIPWRENPSLVKNAQILNAFDLSWETLHDGLARRRVSEAVIEGFAIHKLSMGEDPIALEICGRESGARIINLLESREVGRSRDDDFWLFVSVLHVMDTNDPLGGVENIFPDYEYPNAIRSFVRWLVCDEDPIPDDIEARMIERMNKWVETEKARYRPSTIQNR